MNYRNEIAAHLRNIQSLARKAQDTDDAMEAIEAMEAATAHLKIAIRKAEDWFQAHIDAQGRGR